MEDILDRKILAVIIIGGAEGCEIFQKFWGWLDICNRQWGMETYVPP